MTHLFQKLPPVRNSSKKKKKTNANEKKDPAPKKPIRIKSSDYAAWEKFDVVRTTCFHFKLYKFVNCIVYNK